MLNITCEAITDPPCPRVTITVMGLPVAESVISIWRSTTDGERLPVRGARGVTVVDSFLANDFEAPLAQDVTYEVEVISGEASGASETDTVLLPSECGYIQDPLDPSTAVPVWGAKNAKGQAVLRPNSFSKITYASQGSTFQVMGAKLPVSVASAGSSPAGIPLVWRVRAESENVRLRDLISSSPHLVIRPLPSWAARIPATATYLASSVTESKVIRGNVDNALTDWETTVDIVRPSSARVAISLFTYQDVADMFDTYAQKQEQADGGTYLDDQREPSGSGGPIIPPGPSVDGGGPGTTFFDSTLDGGGS